LSSQTKCVGRGEECAEEEEKGEERWNECHGGGQNEVMIVDFPQSLARPKYFPSFFSVSIK